MARLGKALKVIRPSFSNRVSSVTARRATNSIWLVRGRLIDVGQAADYTAMAGLRRVPRETGKERIEYEGNQQIMTRDGAVLYHCTAGKDRTGTFSALLLTMLGVPRAVVMEDYLLTNQYLATPERIEAFVARGGSREAAGTALGVDRAYLDLMFQAIDKEFGSFDDYRRKALGVSDADLLALKGKLLE